MEKVDILISVVAVIAVVGSIAGAALYEAPTGLQTFGVDFSESSEEDLPAQQQSTGVTASTQANPAAFILEHQVDAYGVTRLAFDVTLDTNRAGGALPRPAQPTYEAYLVAPDGTELREGDAAASGNFAPGTSFTLTVPDTYTMTLPEDTTVDAANLTEAYRVVNETYLSNNTTGLWQVHVHVTFPQGSAPVAETVTAASTPRLQRVLAQVGLDLDIGRSAR